MPRIRPPSWIAPGSPIGSLERRDPSRRANTRILILPEGENEANYFHDLIREVRALSIVIDSARGVPMTLVDKAIEFQKENRRLAHHGERPDYDQIWCLFDGGDKHPNVPKALGSAKESGIRVAVSVPCFEVWQLLHLQELTTRPLTTQEVKQLLRKISSEIWQGHKCVPLRAC